MIEQADERLILKTDTLTVEVLPALGGKIASLCRNGVELLQEPLRPYALRSMTMGFEESDASGFDECLPSVSGCEIPGATIPDHGEFWRLACDAKQSGPQQLRLVATGSVLPLRFERVLTVEKNTLRIAYRVENVGETEVPYVWSAHPLFAISEGDSIDLPASMSEVTVEGSAHARLGAQGKRHAWPVTRLADGEYVDLRQAGRVNDDIGDKLYMPAPREGWAALTRRREKLRIEVGFDPELCPYLGLWICYGGWPEGQAKRQSSVALEPCTAPGDSLARAIDEGWARRLAPGQSYEWWMTISVLDLL